MSGIFVPLNANQTVPAKRGYIMYLLVWFFFQVDRRKSNCVKEVERIEQRRKDRRKENAAIKEHQEEAYDTSDPNWQTSAMIKYVVYFCLEF